MANIQTTYRSRVPANLGSISVRLHVYKGNFIADLSGNSPISPTQITGSKSFEEAIASSLELIEEEIQRLVDEGDIVDPGEVPVRFEFVANKQPVQD